MPEFDRSVLPIPDAPGYVPPRGDASSAPAAAPSLEPLRPPAGAPNVLVRVA